MALVSADSLAEIKNITLDGFVKRHFAKPPSRYMQPATVRNINSQKTINNDLCKNIRRLWTRMENNLYLCTLNLIFAI
jgi:hypothetical protein